MKAAVVTGGGSGIGLAVVKRLRADGLDTASIDLKPSDDESCYTADVTDRSAVDAALSAIRLAESPCLSMKQKPLPASKSCAMRLSM